MAECACPIHRIRLWPAERRPHSLGRHRPRTTFSRGSSPRPSAPARSLSNGLCCWRLPRGHHRPTVPSPHALACHPKLAGHDLRQRRSTASVHRPSIDIRQSARSPATAVVRMALEATSKTRLSPNRDSTSTGSLQTGSHERPELAAGCPRGDDTLRPLTYPLRAFNPRTQVCAKQRSISLQPAMLARDADLSAAD